MGPYNYVCTWHWRTILASRARSCAAHPHRIVLRSEREESKYEETRGKKGKKKRRWSNAVISLLYRVSPLSSPCSVVSPLFHLPALSCLPSFISLLCHVSPFHLPALFYLSSLWSVISDAQSTMAMTLERWRKKEGGGGRGRNPHTETCTHTYRKGYTGTLYILLRYTHQMCVLPFS